MPRRSDGRKQDRPDSQVQVGGRGDNHSVVAAEFEDRAAKPPGHPGTHLPAHAAAAGRADQTHPRIVDNQLTDCPVPDQDRRQTRRYIAELRRRPLEEVLARQCRNGCFLGWFPYHRITAHDRQRRIP